MTTHTDVEASRVGETFAGGPTTIRSDATREPIATALSPKRIALVVVALFALWFGALEVRGLFWPDEGRYAEIALEMLQSGDFVTPRLNGVKYFEKPPLQYWASAIAFAAFDADEWTARLWPATTGFVLVVASAIAWWRWRGPAAGAVAGAVTAGGWGIVLGAQILTLDMGLTLFLSLALLAFIAAHRPGIGNAQRERAIVLAWASMALAVLCKGLVGVVLPALAIAAYAVVERDIGVVRRALSWRGALVFVAIAVPWFVLVQRANPEFFDFFFVQEHFRRFSEAGHNRPGPWWYFVPIVAAGLLPWTASMPAAIRDGWRAQSGDALRVERLLVIWSAVVIAFFSASHSKLPAYVLPALPALGWLLALASSTRLKQMARGAAIASAVAGIAFLVASTQLDRFAKVREIGAVEAGYPAYLAAAGALLLVAGAIVWSSRARLAVQKQVIALAAASLASMQLALAGMHTFDAYYSAERAIETFVGENGAFPRGPPFYSVGMLDQSVPFYLQRPVTLVAHRGELASGIASEPDKYIAERETFERAWGAAHEAYAVMSPETFRELGEKGLPMTVMARDPRRVFVSRGAWPRSPATAAPPF
jgi:4-amino-4-deoxy-L-arabinose transferase-like glycosyltransferase